MREFHKIEHQFYALAGKISQVQLEILTHPDRDNNVSKLSHMAVKLMNLTGFFNSLIGQINSKVDDR